AKQALSDKQYLIWGDNASQDEGIPYGTSYKRLARTWKVQNTDSVGVVQVAVPTSLIPLGGVLLTSDNSNFGNAAATPMVEATLHGASYFVAEASLANGSYFTFAEKLPDIQLTKLEIWNGAQNVLSGFLPSKTNGYESVVPQQTDNVKIVAQANTGISVNLTLTNYLQADSVITDPAQVPIVPGLNKLKIELSNGSSNNVYRVDIIRQLAVGSDGKIELNRGTVTASSFQPNTNYVPANVIDGNWEDPESRWSASGQGQWLQFDMGQPQAVTYLQIAFLNARERQSVFEILESNDPNFATSTLLLAKRKSRSLQSTDSLLQPYVLDKPATARYLRFVGYGNTAAGSSGNWNSMTELAMYTGTPPVIVEPEEPTGPPQAGDVAEGPPPALEIINVSTAEQLQTALDQAKPGIEIRLKSGSYEQNGPFVIKDKQGTAALPIRITAADQGGAIIKGNSYLHIENSNYVEVSGLVFNSGIGTTGLDYRGINASLASEFRGEDSASTTVPKGQIPYAQVHPGLELYNSSNISV
ncbi:discoidin domain-containing protein, partial [Paenibacillus sp. UNC451MF]|uniref:discoidin domain-containing protein n=1 Tax=Paenibacillus sp. UNC451MF TaxID=1449063 RepID=UPI0018CC72F7